MASGLVYWMISGLLGTISGFWATAFLLWNDRATLSAAGSRRYGAVDLTSSMAFDLHGRRRE